VIVDTKTGASGFIANETVANSAPDGRHHWAGRHGGILRRARHARQKLPINVDTDLTPIANIAGVYNMLVFGKHVKFRTVLELIAYDQGEPRQAYLCIGRQRHLAASGRRALQEAGRVNILHVPYRGGAPRSRTSSPAIAT